MRDPGNEESKTRLECIDIIRGGYWSKLETAKPLKKKKTIENNKAEVNFDLYRKPHLCPEMPVIKWKTASKSRENVHAVEAVKVYIFREETGNREQNRTETANHNRLTKIEKPI